MSTQPEVCTIDECRRPAVNRGWCWTHYERWRKHGDPVAGGPLRGDHVAQFWAKVEKQPGESGCWQWVGAIKENGYGKFKEYYAHRWSYEHFSGHIPASLELDHLCRNRACVNPDHLDPVTTSENLNRGHYFRKHVSREDWIRNPWSSKLTADDVVAIRESDEKNKVLALRYGVTVSHIGHIRAHKSWKWVA